MRSMRAELSPLLAYHLRYRAPVERGDLSGAILDGRYRVIEPVAEGAMGVVYRAERLKLGRIVAIKVLHDVLPDELSGRKRFEIEAMAMAKLEHPHCASVLDVGVHGDRPFVVMDFVSGQNLKELISKGPQPIPRAVEIVRQVLSGLAHAHEHGIIHRDIKPANLVLSQKTGLGDHVKILDFGLARVLDTSQNLTAGLAVGTPAYMAPEQVRGDKIDHRADLYACGVLMFELLTGRKPFQSDRDDPIEVCKMHLSDPIPRLDSKLPGVDFGELETVILKALAKRARKRFASAQEYADALDAAMGRSAWLTTAVPRAATVSPTEPLAAVAPDDSWAGSPDAPPPAEVGSGDVMSSEPAFLTPSGAERAAEHRGEPDGSQGAVSPSAVLAELDADAIASAAAAAAASAAASADLAASDPANPAATSGDLTTPRELARPSPPGSIAAGAGGRGDRAATPAAGTVRVAAATPAIGAARVRTATPAAGAPRQGLATPALGMARQGFATPPLGALRARLATPPVGAGVVEPSPEGAAPPGDAGESRAEPVGTFLGMVVTRTPVPGTRSPVVIRPVAPEPAEAAAPHRKPPGRYIVAIVAGLAVAVGAGVAILAPHGAAPAPSAPPAAPGAAARRPDPGHNVIARANELVAQGDKEAALDLLNRSRRQSPDSAGLAYAAGRIYFSKFYWSEGLRNFRDAIRNDPTYRSDPELIKTVLRGFLSTPSYNDDLASFLRDDIGSAVAPLLEETARDHPNAALRSRAAAELRRYR